MFHLDNLKGISDTLGHDAGDAVLVEAANGLSNKVTNVGAVGRIGGDEFAAIIPMPIGRLPMMPSIDNLLEVMRKPFFTMAIALIRGPVSESPYFRGIARCHPTL